MFKIDCVPRSSSSGRSLHRRDFLACGVAGMAGLSLPQLLHAQEESALRGIKTSRKRVILFWLNGGPSHMDTYDMKPAAPSQYRGIWKPIPTNVLGISVSELFPLQAKCMDRISIIRSLHHNTADHRPAAHLMLTSYAAGGNERNFQGANPCIGAVVSKVMQTRTKDLPAYVSIPVAQSIDLRPGYFGGSYLGNQHNPFETDSDPNNDNDNVSGINITKNLSIKDLSDRSKLLSILDHARRDVEQRGRFETMNRFQQQAFAMLTSPAAREAFDLSRVSQATRERYGRHTWGQSALLAGRLAEAGVTFTTVLLDDWDQHFDLEEAMKQHLPKVDQLLSALFTDLWDKGLSDEVLVVVCGEFSRTPWMNDGRNVANGEVMGAPGRHHWANSMFCLMGGGGIKGGRIVGATDRLGESPITPGITPADIHHTIYHCLGIDEKIRFVDHGGRPTPIADRGRVLKELF